MKRLFLIAALLMLPASAAKPEHVCTVTITYAENRPHEVALRIRPDCRIENFRAAVSFLLTKLPPSGLP